MADKKENYFVPEQLEDDDFEKEKLEEKKKRKEKKLKSTISDDEESGYNKSNKTKTVIGLVVFIFLVALCVIWYVMPHEKKVSKPEQFVKDFCAYFNSGNWRKVNSFLDFKGYYILGSILKEEEYPKFDATYKKLKEDETYMQYCQMISTLIDIDEETLKEFTNIQIKLNNIEACNLIQGTDTLYKLRVNFDYIYDGESENVTGVIYISNINGEYKMIYGEWIQTILNYYHSVYMFQNNYGY